MGDQYPDEKNALLPCWQQRIFILGFRLFLILQCNRKSKQRLDRHETIVAERCETLRYYCIVGVLG